MTDAWLASWAKAFGETVAIETIVLAAILWRVLPVVRLLIAAVALQMVTHPTLWLAWPVVSLHVDYWPLVIIAETIVVLVEGALLVVVLGRERWRRAFVASLAANAVSTVVGLLL